MALEDLLEVKTLIKFAVLFIPLTIFIFIYADGMKWKLLFTFAGFIGLVIALSGKTLGKRHGFGGGR